MKKIKVLILFLFFIPFFVNAQTCDTNSISIKSISLNDKTDNVEIKHEAIVDDESNIHLDFSMSEIGDEIKYNVVIENSSNQDYVLNHNNYGNNSNYIKYTLSSDDKSYVIKANSEKEFNLSIEYENEVPESDFTDNKYNVGDEVILNIVQNNNVINPKTGIAFIKTLLIILIVSAVFVFCLSIKKSKTLSVLLLLIIPISIYASCNVDIKVESNIEIVKDTSPILMKQVILEEDGNFLRTNISINNIESVVFKSSFEGHEINNTDCFDVSLKENGTVIAWIDDEDNDNLYEVYIAGDQIVYASDLSNFFSYFKNLERVDGLELLDTSKVTNMSYMFRECGILGDIDLSHLDTSKVINMNGMFEGCESLTILDLSTFDTSKVTNMNSMFKDCKELTTIYASDLFVTSNVNTSTNMFAGDTNLVGEKGSEYNSNHIDKNYALIDKGTILPGYFTLKGVNIVTIYYNSSNVPGEFIKSKKVAYCNPNSEGLCNISIPSSVSESVGKFNSAFKGLSSSFSNMDNITEIHDNDTLYAYYQSEVTNYYYDESYKTRTLYRSEVFTSNSEMNSVLSLSDDELVNYENETLGPNNGTFTGFSFNEDSVVDFLNVNEAANSSYNELYSVYKYKITYKKGYNIGSIGKNSDSCNFIYEDTYCYVVLPNLYANPGYEEIGFAVSSYDGIVYLPNTEYRLYKNNMELSANAFNYKYLNVETGVKYFVLRTAFDEVQSNQTIKVINNRSNSIDSSSAIIKAEITGVKFDLNGNAVNNKKIINRGELDIYNSSTNPATLYHGFDNYGTLTLNGTSSENKLKIIKETHGGLTNGNDATLTINDNVEINVNYGSGATLRNNGNMFMNGGSVISSSTEAIDNSYTGTIYVNSDNAQITSSGSNALVNTGIAYIRKGTLTGASNGFSNTSGSYNGVTKYGTAYISGGTIIGGTIGVYNQYKMTITGGTITGVKNGIKHAGGSLTIGENDSDISTSTPLIQATGESYSYGVSINSNAEFNFYDGIIKSSSGSGNAIFGSITEIPSNCILHVFVENGVESAILEINSS